MTANARPYQQLDVFSDRPYFGNPLAVVLNAEGLSEEVMQRFARWTNLSETAFLLPPTKAGADYRVRIFTPGAELPFAGHPTLGACHAWLDAGGRSRQKDRVVQECALGLVEIRKTSHLLAFAAPPLRQSTPDAAILDKITRALGLQSEQILASRILDNGPVFLGLLLDHPDTVLNLQPDHTALKQHGIKVGVASPYPTKAAPFVIARSSREARAFADHADAPPRMAEPDLEVRAFVAPMGVTEDPVTGSLNASLAQWLIADGHMPASYVAAQGTCLGREGRVHISSDQPGQVWVGGQVNTCVKGRVKI
ncbi:MAG: PhzF family phenazine biosynthesis protein [Hylemonella sp.]